jgi:hypothetical protein
VRSLVKSRKLFIGVVCLFVSYLALVWGGGKNDPPFPPQALQRLEEAMLSPEKRICVLANERPDQFQPPSLDSDDYQRRDRSITWCVRSGVSNGPEARPLWLRDDVLEEQQLLFTTCYFSKEREFKFHLGSVWTGECRQSESGTITFPSSGVDTSTNN